MVNALRAVQSRADAKNSGAPLTWNAINNMIGDSGSPMIDYDRFAARWESDPILKQIVDRFDGNGLVIKTQQGMEQPEQGNPDKKAANAVDNMAKSATKKAMNAN